MNDSSEASRSDSPKFVTPRGWLSNTRNRKREPVTISASIVLTIAPTTIAFDNYNVEEIARWSNANLTVSEKRQENARLSNWQITLLSVCVALMLTVPGAIGILPKFMSLRQLERRLDLTSRANHTAQQILVRGLQFYLSGLDQQLKVDNNTNV